MADSLPSRKADTILGREAIAARIPHAGAMCLLDTAEHWNVDTIRCSTERHLGTPHPLAAPFDLDRFRRGDTIDETGSGPMPNSR